MQIILYLVLFVGAGMLEIGLRPEVLDVISSTYLQAYKMIDLIRRDPIAMRLEAIFRTGSFFRGYQRVTKRQELLLNQVKAPRHRGRNALPRQLHSLTS